MNRNILYLCEVGDLIEVEKCLDEGMHPNFQNNEGESPLQVAAANGFTDLVALLLKHGASIDLPNNYGWTPLMHAAKYGHASTVSFLLKMKAKVNVSNKLGISAIVAAACSGHLPTVKLLVEAGAMIDHMSAGNETSECDLSTVMAAALYGHGEILQYFLENDVDIDHSSAVTGLTPLMLASCSGHKHIVSILVERGVDLHKKDICGRTALDISHIFNRSEVKIYLESLTASKTVIKNCSLQKMNIFDAIKNGDTARVKLLLEKDQDSVNSAELHNGITPLMWASIFGHWDIVNFLIFCGANLDTQDIEKGWTALMHAVYHRNGEIVRLLLDMGADVDICAFNGCTVLNLAQQNDNCDPRIVEMLRLVSHDVKNSVMQSPEHSNRGRLSVPERLPSKRSLSQTRVKEWIGGVAQHLQNKMLTLRSSRFSENVASIEVTASVDESFNEVFTEQIVPLKEIDKDKSSDPVMLPPDLYLADALKEHKVEAIIPPFPSIFTESVKDNQKKSSGDKASKPSVKSLRLPNLLKNYAKKKALVNSRSSEMSRTDNLKESISTAENKLSCTVPQQDIDLYTTTEINQKEIQIESAATNLKPCAGDLTVLLNKESLQKYIDTFRDQEVDLDTFQHLTEADLSEIGIEGTESQKKLMEIITKLSISE